METNDVDLKEFQKQYREEAQKDGLVMKIYVEKVGVEDLLDPNKNGQALCTPSVSIEGHGSPFMQALLIKTCERAIKSLLEDPNVAMAKKLLDIGTKEGKEIAVGGESND